MSASRSIESRLLLGIVAAIAASGLVTCTLTFAWALQDANEVADGALKETTSLLRSGRVTLPPTPSVLPGTEHDNDVLVWQLPQPGPVPRDVPLRDVAAPCLQTVTWRGERWRVLATPDNPGGWLMAAQRMEVRDEIARNSAVRSVLPLLVLLPLLALLARAVIKGALAPVRRLASHVDGRPLALAAQLPELEVPAEVHPFVGSIRRLVHELSQALEQQQRFVANAAHELRTPVAALSLQAANLGNVLADPAARDRMHELSQGIARLQALLEQLMSMARAQLHRRSTPQRVRLDELAREMLAEFVPPAAERGIDIGVDTLAGDAVVLADRFDLELLLRNVIGNALKFCPPGSEVTLDLAVDAAEAVLTVSDDGPGIAADDLPFAFEPFYRAPGVDAPGSGLGLAIVATLAQRLQARVSLRANPAGRGMVFEYRQPLAPA